MTTITRKIRFENSGYYFVGLLTLAFLGFWRSYFSKFFNGTLDYNFYFHFHATMMALWILALIAQPILIKQKKLVIHKIIGKLSFVLMPLVFISVILLTHFQIQKHVEIINGEKFYGPHLMIPFKDLLILGTAYIIAIVYRHDINIHARAMVATGLTFIEPAFIRLLKIWTDRPTAFLFTIALVYSILISLMIVERHQKNGRWVFPLVLVLFMIVHALVFFHVNIGAWEMFAQWFAALPLTSSLQSS